VAGKSAVGYIRKGCKLIHHEQDYFSVSDAAYHTVHSYPGGTVSLGPRVGINPTVLAHKVNPNNGNQYKLGLNEAVTLQAITGDYRILHAMARDLGHVVIQVHAVDDESVNKCLSQTVKEFGEFLSTVSDSLEDGQITDRELAEIRAHLGTMVAQSNRLAAQLTAKNEQLHKQYAALVGA